MPHEKLIEGCKNGDENSLNELYKKMKYCIIKEVSRFYREYKCHLEKCGYMDYEDLIQMGNLSFVKAIQKYNIAQDVCFTTYLVCAIRNDLCVYFFPNKTISKDYKANADNELIDDNILYDIKKQNTFDNIDLKLAMEKLTEEEKELIYDKFYIGLSTKEMQDKYKISSMTITKKRNIALQKLRKYMEG